MMVATGLVALTLAPVLQANLLARPALPPAAGFAAEGGWPLRLRGGERNDLHSAVLTGSVFAVDGLIGEGADVDAPNGAGLSALHLAAEARRLAVAALLVAKGADVNVCDGAERTPLHYAAARGHRGTIMVLLELGADLAAADERGWTPLHEAAAAHQVPPLSATVLFCISDRPGRPPFPAANGMRPTSCLAGGCSRGPPGGWCQCARDGSAWSHAAARVSLR